MQQMQIMFIILAFHIFIFIMYVYQNHRKQNKIQNSQSEFKSLLRQGHFNHIFCSSLLLIHKGEEELPKSG